MYKFVGKKGQMYKIDLDEIVMKLNYRCEKGTVEADSFSCGKTPEERKKNYNKQQKGQGKLPVTKSTSSESITTLQSKLKSLEKDSRQHITKIHKLDGTTIDVESEIKRIKGQLEKIGNNLDSKSVKSVQNPIVANKIGPLVTKTKTIIEKVKKEKASGKASKETTDELKSVIDNLKNSVKSDNTHENISNFISKSDIIIYSSDKYINSMKDYIRASFDINKKLRKSPIGAKVSDKKITAITELLDKSIVPSNTVLYRGISPVQWESLPKDKGTTYIDKNFVSTTTNEKVATGFAKFGFGQDVKHKLVKNSDSYYTETGAFKSSMVHPYVLEIRVNENTKGLSLEKFVDKEFPDEDWIVGGDGEIGTQGNQKEVLLQRSQQFRVIGTKEYKDHTRLIIETYNN